tara:strand:- start:83 stop:472 length:390 start_codon:yes stop_codon:yes gene_type:complete
MKMFALERTVVADDIDDLDHVNNITYLYWIQDASKNHWEELTKNLTNDFHLWIVRSHQIEYKRPARLGDKIIINTYVKRSKGFLSDRIVEISLKKSKQLLVRCKTQWCYINKETQNPERIPEYIISLLT